eukprot:m.335714 g.335714  ORF g.335714 m.335714 type:complete len:695 (+) comp17660_c0_seq1:123-2207(+)
MMKVVCLLAFVAGCSAQIPARVSSKGGSVLYKLDPTADVEFDFGGDVPLSVKGMDASVKEMSSDIDDLKKFKTEVEEFKKQIADKVDTLEENLVGNITEVETVIESTIDQILNETAKEFSETNADVLSLKRDMHEVNDTVQEHSGMFGSMQSMIKVLTDYDHEKHSDEYVDFHKDICHERSRGYNTTGETCVDCTSFPKTAYNSDSRACSASSGIYSGATEGEEDEYKVGTCTGWSEKTNLFQRSINVAESGEFEAFFKVSISASWKYRCYQSNSYYYAQFYLVIDGGRQNLCAYKRDTRYDFSSSKTSTLVGDVVCSTRVILTPGKHTLAITINGAGNVAYSGSENSVASYFRYVGTPLATTKTESKANCKTTLANNLVTSYFTSGWAANCVYCTNFRGWTDISSRARGPWSVRTRSGYAHVFIKIRQYMRTYPRRGSGRVAQTQVQIRVNGASSNAACSTIKYTRLNTRSSSDYEYDYGQIICSALVRVTSGRISIHHRSYGDYNYNYGSSSSPHSIVRIEEVPAPQTTVPAALETGCQNPMQRRIIALSKLTSSFASLRVGSLSTKDLTQLKEVKFTVAEETKVRVNFKADVQLTSSSSYFGNKVQIQIIPVVDGKSLPVCSDFSRSSTGVNMNTIDNINCNFFFTVDKGTHSLKFKVKSAGNSVAILSTEQSNLLFVEAMFNKQTFSTKH